jgi:predicted permease
MLLSLLGAACGLLLSIAGVHVLLALLPSEGIPFAESIGLDGWVLSFTLGLSLITGIVFGLAPSLQATRRELREGISEGGRSIGQRREQTRSVLVAAEVALALVLLAGAGLLLKSFLKMQTLDRGFRSASIVTATVDLPKSRYRTALQMRLFDQHILSSLSLLPGAKSVASISYLPFGWGVRGDFQLENGRHVQHGFYVDKPVVSTNYFHTMGIRLINGRDFTEHDNAGAPGVVIISESVARRLWPAGDAVGKRISMADHPKPGDWLTIVGVVDDIRQGILTDSPSTTIYLPYLQVNQAGFLQHMSFVVQKSNGPVAMASAIRDVIHEADPNLPAQSILSMDAIMAESMTAPRSQARLLSIFSILALLLAAAGIYGVLACSVAERTHEIGIRMAVGAAQKDIVRMVLRRTLILAGSGVAIGTAGALAVTRVLEKFLFDVKPTDPATLIGVTVFLVAVAMLAAWVPAHRASRISPSDALRHE